MSTDNQAIGKIRSASARGNSGEAIRLAKELPQHMRDGVIAGLKRTHQLEECSVCEGEGGWLASYGPGGDEDFEVWTECQCCVGWGFTDPRDREEWHEELARGIEAQEDMTPSEQELRNDYYD